MPMEEVFESANTRAMSKKHLYSRIYFTNIAELLYG